MLDFPIDQLKADQAKKSEIAQKLANWFVQNKVALPVYLDDKKRRRTYYEYIDELGVWQETSENQVMEIAKKQLGDEWTTHMVREFKNNIQYHDKAVMYKDMGLPENKVLCLDGKIYNLDTGEVENVSRSNYTVNLINADPEDPGDTELWEKFLEETIPKEDHRKTLQEFVGWTLRYPNDDFEKALIIIGDTNSGKSTIFKVLRELFKYCNLSSLSMTQIGQEKTFHIPRLKNTFLNIDGDMSSAEIENGSTVKKVISQEEQYVELKHVAEGFPVKPNAKFMVASNVAPRPSTKDDRAFYQRFITLEAPHTVPEDEQDKQLVDKLTTRERLNGLFQWALEGLERLEEQGNFTYSPSIMETREKWDQYGSDVQKFIYDCIEKKKDSHVPTKDMYDYYEIWAMDQLGDTLSKQDFISQIKKNPRLNYGRVRLDNGSQRRCFKHVDVEIP